MTKIIGLLVTFLASISLAEAQAPKIPRIGYVSGTGSASNQGPYVEALRQGLRDLGYTEGKNYVIEYRGSEGKPDRIPDFARELVEVKVDVLVVPTLPAILAAKQATATIPVVMVTNTDPVEARLVDSLARPGGNITGLSTLSGDLNGKRLELLAEVVPRLSHVGVLRDADSQRGAIALKEYEIAGTALKIKVQAVDVRGHDPDFEGSFQTAAKRRINGLITITNANLFLHQKRITDLALKLRLPTMFEGSTWVERGGLMSYSTDDLAVYRRVATYVDKILKGAKPADLPVEQPTKFELVININTAKQISVTIPQKVLARADRVIR